MGEAGEGEIKQATSGKAVNKTSTLEFRLSGAPAAGPQHPDLGAGEDGPKTPR
jgi:hypothetical protein